MLLGIFLFLNITSTWQWQRFFFYKKETYFANECWCLKNSTNSLHLKNDLFTFIKMDLLKDITYLKPKINFLHFILHPYEKIALNSFLKNHSTLLWKIIDKNYLFNILNVFVNYFKNKTENRILCIWYEIFSKGFLN